MTLAVTLILPCPLRAQIPAGRGDWPQWRGPNRDGLSTETGLLKDWPSAGPPVVWQVDTVGVAYSTVSIKDGRIFTQGDRDGVEHVICLSAETGSLLWAVQPDPAARRLSDRLASDMKRLDRDADGELDDSEVLAGGGPSLLQFDKPVEEDPNQVAADRAARLIHRADKDSDGRIDFTEIPAGLRQSFAQIDSEDKDADAATLAQERTKAIFKLADRDEDGSISRREAGNSPVAGPFDRIDREDPNTNSKDQQLTTEEVEAYLVKFEAGRDGKLSADELAQYFAARYRGRDGLFSIDGLRAHLGGYRNSYGDGPRGVPTIDDDRVYTVGGMGDLTCLDAATGKTIWHKHLVSDLGGSVPGWGYSESPLMHGSLLIVTPGGQKGTLAALDKMTGEVVWRSEGVTEPAQYSSPVFAELGGVRQIVQLGYQSVFGVRADTGQRLWNYAAANNRTANVCTPIAARDHVFASSNYNVGGGLVRISSADDGQKADEAYFEKRMANHHGGILLIGDHLYGFGNGGLICMEFLTGKIAWTSRSVSKGSLVFADGMLYCLGEGHQIALAEANPNEYREHGRFKFNELGRPSWSHPVVAGGRLYIRNQQQLTAYDIRQRASN